MNIGDKVRLVHGKEEGIIYAFLPGNVVEVEIEDGFRIPVLRKEIVTISPVESQKMVKESATDKIVNQNEKIIPRNPVFAEKGIYLAFLAVNDRSLTVHLVNNTDWILPYTASAIDNGVASGIGGGALQPRTTQKLTEVLMKDFEVWPTFEIRMLFYREGKHVLPLGLTKKLKCRVQSFYKSKGTAPILGREAYIYQLDEEKLVKEEVLSDSNLSETLRESMLGGGKVEQSLPLKPENIVDLHIEKLKEDYKKLSSDEILKLQLKTFEDCLERAIANGMDEMTFIHGAGSGVLRTEIHRKLGKNQHVQFYQDAQKEKFGYGATYVKIK